MLTGADGAHLLAGLPLVADVRDVFHSDPMASASIAAWTMTLLVSGWMCRTRPHFFWESYGSFCLALWLPLDGRQRHRARERSRLPHNFPAAKDFASAYRGDVLLPDIYTQHGAGGHSLPIFRFDDEV
ncbi:hypothetical protein [Candidatus Methylacidithermus pantelleriae]|uniref:Uncharacterized protein n=1 Tax=Candidatus Methylacidithermus pantelleriae TaxID=2744239 RepID=A0A8J2BMT9_9BACT|nr:hypothetical protein [Candidatus Methylacidithermus pantelleriae]CAF0697222.1 hypothetical protein MPNT_210013 [Candidatus Methylacidithermus pantelleriae]